jgi:lipid-A-disaccharide synthase
MIVAGEASGDLHAAGVAEALRRDHPGLPLVGVGGTGMEAAGVRLLYRTDSMAVMGFVEVLRRIPQHYALFRELVTRLRSGRVAALVTIDYPGFNLRLATAAHAAGVPVLYYITPQVWAWGASRLPKMARVIRKAAVILPFEEELLRRHGIDATFVGHPLLDRAEALPDRDGARERLGLPRDARVLALFPGSRAQEIENHLDTFVEAAALVADRHPGVRVLVAAAPGVSIPPAQCPYPLVTASSLLLLRAADASLCKSGTSTLEASVAGCPLVIAYRTSRWTHAVARRVVRIPHIGLVNVVAGREVVREFVQDAMRAPAIADALDPLLDPASGERSRMLSDLAGVRGRLGTPGAARRVASMIASLAA